MDYSTDARIAVQKIWETLTEDYKRNLLMAFRKKDPEKFASVTGWIHGMRGETISHRKFPRINQQFDENFTIAKSGKLARAVLTYLFVNHDKHINSTYLALLLDAHNKTPQATVCNLVPTVLTKLESHCQDSCPEIVRLYGLTLRWLFPEYFEGNIDWSEVVRRASDADEACASCKKINIIDNQTGINVFQGVSASLVSITKDDNMRDELHKNPIPLDQESSSNCVKLLENIYDGFLLVEKKYERYNACISKLLAAHSVGDIDGLVNEEPNILSEIKNVSKLMKNDAEDVIRCLVPWHCEHQECDCEARQLLAHASDILNIRLQSIEGKVRETKKIIVELQKKIESKQTKIREMKGQIAKVYADLDEILSVKSVLQNEDIRFCALCHFESELTITLGEGMSRQSEKLNSISTSILAEITLLRSKYNILTGEYDKELKSICSDLMSCQTLQEQKPLRERFARIKESASTDIKLLDVCSLVARYKNDHDANDLLHLSLRLIDQSAEVPALRLIQWASVTNLSFIGTCRPDMIGEVLVHVLSNSIRNKNDLASLILNIPVLQSSTLNHISDIVLRERIALALVASIVMSQNKNIASVFNYIYTGTLQRFVGWSKAGTLIAQGETLSFASVDDDVKIKAIREKLHERVRRENGLFVHLECRKAKYYGHFEGEAILPALLKLLEDIEADLNSRDYLRARSRITSINPVDFYRSQIKKYGQNIQEHPHFTKQLVVTISHFFESCMGYIELFFKNNDVGVLSLENLIVELEQWCIERKIDKLSDNQYKTIIELFRNLQGGQFRFKNQDLCFPDTLTELTAPLTEYSNLRKLYYSKISPSSEESLEALLADVCTISDKKHNDEAELMSRSQLVSEDDASDFEGNMKSTVETNLTSELKSYEYLIRASRFGAARAIFERAKVLQEDALQSTQRSELEIIDSLLARVSKQKDAVEKVNAAPDWILKALALCNQIELHIRSKRRGSSTLTLEALCNLVNTLEFEVEHPDVDFNESNKRIQDLAHPSEWSISKDSRVVPPQAVSLLEQWKALYNAAPSDRDKFWRLFCKGFCEYCGMYYELFNTLLIRKESDETRSPYQVLETKFKRPRCQYLNRSIFLHLYEANTIKPSQRQYLVDELRSDALMPPHHLVFCCTLGHNLVASLGKQFESLALSAEDVEALLCADKTDSLVRSRLYRSAGSLSACSPFSSEGYVHTDFGLFVGRRGIIREMAANPQSALWGGRKIGKTSLLQAHAQGLEASGYKVAYVYADPAGCSTDPDLALACRTCRSLGFAIPSSLEDFERILQEARVAGLRLAFLIDEIDEYIKASKPNHGGKFPFASKLRQVCMEDTAGLTRLVYAGYHQLYAEAHPVEARRVAHPFVNIAHEIRLDDLSAGEVKELVLTGFEELLGVKTAIDAPRLIFKYTSGHPAFVQQFCKLLVILIESKRKRGGVLEVTSADIVRIYEQNRPDDVIHSPFVCFVEEVLGMNLTYLGRAVVIIFADRILERGLPHGAELNIDELVSHIREWSNISGVEEPIESHIRLTLELLQMTNILKLSSDKMFGRVSFRFPIYVDILSRLGQLEQTRSDIAKLLVSYDSEERSKGVLR